MEGGKRRETSQKEAWPCPVGALSCFQYSLPELL